MIADTEEDEFVDAPSEPEDDNVEYAPNRQLQRRRSSDKTFVTASSVPTADEDHVDRLRDEGPEQQDQNQHQTRASGLQVPSGQSHAGSKSLGKRPLSNVESIGDPASTTGPASVDANSTSSLLRKADMNKAPALADVDSRPPAKGILARVKRRSEMRSSSSGQVKDADPTTAELTRKKSNLRNLVKFDVPEDSRRATVQLKAKKAQMTIQRAGTKVRRQKIKDGLVIKMERMLVRVDAAAEVPEDFDENVNQRVVSRVKDKWREYMVVCRHSHLNNADFVLQFYQTRVSYLPCCPPKGNTDSILGHSRNRKFGRRQEGRVRGPARSENLQSQSILLARQVHGHLIARGAQNLDFHHASPNCLQCCRVVHIPQKHTWLATRF